MDKKADRRIFVIDDEEPIRKVLKTHLSKEGYTVYQSAGGSGVFAELQQNPFDVLICDMMMPEVDGLKVIEFVRERLDTTPVIMLTGLNELSLAVEVMKKGTFDYLTKPVRKEDLLNTVRKALAYGGLLKKNKRLEKENEEYRLFLEDKVAERTKELNNKTVELENANRLLKSVNIQFVNVLADTIEAKDRHTSGHCHRMGRICVEIGRLMGLDATEMELLEYASVLHDLGKLGISELVLNKNGPLDENELRHIKEHPGIGERILNNIDMMGPVARIIGSHHENFDGSGYPRGLKGAEIPVCARIISVADVFDAMSSNRPYRKGLPFEKIITELNRVSGTQLDPEIVSVFIENSLFTLDFSRETEKVFA